MKFHIFIYSSCYQHDILSICFVAISLLLPYTDLPFVFMLMLKCCVINHPVSNTLSLLHFIFIIKNNVSFVFLEGISSFISNVLLVSILVYYYSMVSDNVIHLSYSNWLYVFYFLEIEFDFLVFFFHKTLIMSLHFGLVVCPSCWHSNVEAKLEMMHLGYSMALLLLSLDFKI